MAAYHLVYDLRQLQADCQEPGSAPEPYTRQSTMGYFYLFSAAFTRAAANVGATDRSSRSRRRSAGQSFRVNAP